jgi:phosphatidylethanolamine-binding protein (PEBP) family uncharacterized protein
MNVLNPDTLNMALIPARFTGEGEDVSPALAWEDPPDRSL